jgi:hypothetical protein
MELVERYLQAVKFWLPRDKQDDIIAELREDMRSEIEEKEAALGHPLDKGELEALLKRRGPPVVVAGRYLPQRHLIGPVWFPIYWLVLRLAMTFFIVPWLVVWLILVLNSPAYRAAHPGLAIFGTLSTLWTTIWVQFAIITIIFAALDRYQTRPFIVQWKPSQLAPLKKRTDRVSRVESTFGLAFSAMFLYWLLSAPAFPWMVFGPAAGLVQFNPALRVFYLPIVLLILVGTAQQVLNLFRPEWIWLPPVTRLATSIGGMVLLKFISEVYPYVILSAPAANVARYGKVVDVANFTFALTLGCWWLALAIACVVHTVQCLGHLRRWLKRPTGPAPAQSL